MTAARSTAPVSVDAYLAGELTATRKHEYVAGAVYAMAGAKNAHNVISGNLFGVLHASLAGKACQPFNSDTKVRIQLPTHTRFYYPDGMVVCDENPLEDSFQDRPVVVAEVLSESTRRTDQGEKLDAYLTIPSLSVCLLVEQEQPAVVAMRRTDQGFIRQVFSGLDQTVPLPEVEAALPLAQLYARVPMDA
ncbi:MAG: Uma2 family endonuclease [Planctomycetota bacterium]